MHMKQWHNESLVEFHRQDNRHTDPIYHPVKHSLLGFAVFQQLSETKSGKGKVYNILQL